MVTLLIGWVVCHVMVVDSDYWPFGAVTHPAICDAAAVVTFRQR